MKSLKIGSDVRICDFLTAKQDFICSLMISECDNVMGRSSPEILQIYNRVDQREIQSNFFF